MSKEPAIKMGTRNCAIVCGIIGALIAVLLLAIGFWKTLLLCVLFGVGYFLGTVENKREFMKMTANKLIPDKEVKVIDLKTELKREQSAVEQAVEEVIKPAKKTVKKTAEKTTDKE